ncbi:hypothetical protein Asppvi_000062 [Aspergillus pseudoviridinutans]|uniref:T6SS Phospholipase effector Tle1-like catalytic domain-containing protein n=1 Tax=Aspergillus pseudoviridinutans TaxID=1517512 RepID=A0A9P3EQ45_9EURO|nr:uncharacterized protein Asppvi_000062 [Aspergillus pseudoviridinutans]GIJ81563.1 hypothetical protein Asppvi_000062 [Aspergillus pseudoviridinutans]
MDGRAKRIIVCCDGTACSSYKRHGGLSLTNVSRISRSIKAVADNGTPQMVFYQPGIGTAAANPLNILNQGIGSGIDEKIMEAYSFICHNYSGEDDKIILIGFSRGAFTVRCIADFIHKAGLLTKVGLFYLTQLYDLWVGGKLGTDNVPEAFRTGVLGDPTQVRPSIRINACAVWDTVCSLGVPQLGFSGPRLPSRFSFVLSDLCEGIENAFQALSLHERRLAFLPYVWKPRETNHCSLQQCWFMGYHADIGGGNKDECLAHFALAWMISKLDPFVEFNKEYFWMPTASDTSWKLSAAPTVDTFDPPFMVGLQIPDSMNLFYWLWGSIHRKPRRQFWTHVGFEQFYPPVNNISKEFMHSTVRLLTFLGALDTCPSLKGGKPERRGNQWIWNLRLRPKSPFWAFVRAVEPAPTHETYEVVEDPMGPTERELLKQWLNSELYLLQERANENDPDPQTLIPYLLEWLDKQLAN